MKRYRLLLAVAMMAVTTGAMAQSSTMTPYSKVGYGMLNDNASGLQRSMGGVGYAMQNGRVINAMNPASYSQVDSLTFLWDVGVGLTNLWQKEGEKSAYNFGGGLDYLRGLFRITRGLGGSLGLVPYSSVGYSFGSDINGGGDYRTGSGGLNQLYVGLGYQPVKGLSIGANVAYLFGTTQHVTTVTNDASTAIFTRTMEVRDWNLQAGLQYAVGIGANDRMVIGLTYQPKKSFHGHTWGQAYDLQDSKTDTIGYTSLKGRYEQPHSFGVGLSYEWNHRLTAEADFTYQNWKDVKYEALKGFEDANMRYDNRWKAAAGVQYTPNRRGSYLGAMMFRAGGFYNHDYMNISGNNVRDYGASIGVGLPVPNGKTTVNIGLEWRHRYSAPVSMISEDYLNITIGININELWFWKNKIR